MTGSDSFNTAFYRIIVSAKSIDVYFYFSMKANVVGAL